MLLRVSPGTHDHAVTSTAASVGPYRLCSSTPGRRSWKRSTRDAGSASPLHTTHVRPEHRADSSCARNASSIDGTKCAFVTPCWRIASLRYSGSLCPPGRAITSFDPDCSVQKNSHTDTSKLNGVFCSTTSDGPKPYIRCIHTRRLTTPRCSFIAPFGVPVEPDV